MNPNNLIFSSKIHPQIEDATFDILLNHLSLVDYDEISVKNVIFAPNELLFFTEIEGNESIIRVPVNFD